MRRVVKLVMICLYLGIAVIFLRTPLFSDDYLNADDVYRGSVVRVDDEFSWTSFAQVPNKISRVYGAVVTHYLTDNGRVLPAIFVRIFSSAPRVLFAVVGTLFFWLLVMSIRSLSGISSVWNPALAGIAIFTLFQEDAVVWLTGSMAYAWPMTWTLACVCLFTQPFLQKSPLERNMWWMWILIPAMFLAALGHEVIGVPLGFAAATYWVLDVVKFRRIRFNGRLLMSIGYAVGLIALVFSPGTLHRSGMGGDLPYRVLCKLCVMTYGLLLNPWFYVMIVTTVVSLKKGLWSWDSRMRWVLLLFFYELILVGIFGTISPRAVWPLAVVTMVLALCMLQKSSFDFAKRYRYITSVCLLLGGVTVVSTIVTTEIKRVRVTQSLSDWQKSSFDLCVIPEGVGWFADMLFDRSFPIGEAIIWGASGYGGQWNKALARLYGKKMIYGISKRQWEILLNKDYVCNDENRLPIDGEWYYYQDAECIISPCSSDVSCGAYSIELKRKQDSPLRGLRASFVAESVILRARANVGGLGIFRTSAFAAAFIRDIIYMTLFTNRPFDGFVADFPSGRFIVLPCRRFRSLVRD